MIVNERAAANLGDLKNLNDAKRALMRGDHNSHVWQRHKWLLDEHGLMKKVIPLDNVKIVPPPKNKVVPLSSVVQSTMFYRAVPEAKNWTASVRNLRPGVNGMANTWSRHITVIPSRAKAKGTWVHEATHLAQKALNEPRNGRGSNPIAAGSVAKYRANPGEVHARLAADGRPVSAKAQVLINRARNRGVTRPKIKPPAAPPKAPQGQATPKVKGRS